MTLPIRQPIDLPSLTAYLSLNNPSIPLPLQISQFAFGQSNPTYLLTSPSSPSKFVLRKKPVGALLSKSAHNVEREYKILHALQDTVVPVPKMYGLCVDESVIGSPFYIMEYLDGRIFEDAGMPGVDAQERRALWMDAIRTLGTLHAVDANAVGLEGFGKMGEFYGRQLRTFGALNKTQAKVEDVETGERVGNVPHFLEFVRFFGEEERAPRDRATLVHGDFKIDNLVFHPTEPRVIGILDWEMSTIGHPLSDLSILLEPYTLTPRTLSRRLHSNPSFHPATLARGLPSRKECIALYAELSGYHDVARDIPWGTAFAMFRNAVIFQGIRARFALRQASNETAKEVGAEMAPIAEIARGLVEETMGLAGPVRGKL